MGESWRVGTCADEARLFNANPVHFLGDGKDRVADLFDPEGHVICNGNIRSITQCVPKILRCCIPVGVFFQVIADSLL